MNWKCALGLHQWRETSRWSSLFDTVNYICLVCGTVTERWEHPDRGELSMDPKVKAEQLESREERRQRALRDLNH